MSTRAIVAAAHHVGGVTALARILGVKPPTVSQWLSGVRPVPLERCVEIEMATGGAVTRRELRPKDWKRIWPELSDRRAQV